MPTTSPEPEGSHARYWRMKLTLPVDDQFWNGHSKDKDMNLILITGKIHIKKYCSYYKSNYLCVVTMMSNQSKR